MLLIQFTHKSWTQTADNVAYIAHYVSHVQQGVHAAVNVDEMTVFSMLYADGFNATLLHHGGNVIHVMSVKWMRCCYQSINQPTNQPTIHWPTYNLTL
jgi:hypothetical protein